ncbi:MAG: prephenate dehydrogenase/arogenate dehydrogenase family protein [Gammaproteobacteria bacterium]|nr:prephenate dehydrogenase/arogenate dehydrogenase family protein [Gammaproteobacteria bacterium]
MDFYINKLVIIGVGLIGGSFALALREAGVAREIVGAGRSAANLEEALRLGAIDRIAPDAAEAVRDADLVMLAVPVGQMAALMQQIAPCLGAHTVVTDAGSTKGDVVALARRHLPQHLASFVPGHPIAGAEKSGVGAADAGLFRGRQTVLTPLPETGARATELVLNAWQACGARVAEMAPENHDRIFAAVSHLPHLLAFALVEDMASRANGEELFSFAAGGFRDFTRIAGSSPEMWRDIFLANREPLLDELDLYRAQLDRLRAMLEQGDGAALEKVFSRARAARNKWIAKKNLD